MLLTAEQRLLKQELSNHSCVTQKDLIARTEKQSHGTSINDEGEEPFRLMTPSVSRRSNPRNGSFLSSFVPKRQSRKYEEIDSAFIRSGKRLPGRESVISRPKK